MPNPVQPGDPPTDRQVSVLRYIYETIESSGRRPTVREIVARFGMSSPNAIDNHLKALHLRGYIRRKGVRRGQVDAYDLLKLPDGSPFRGFRAVRETSRDTRVQSCGTGRVGEDAEEDKAAIKSVIENVVGEKLPDRPPAEMPMNRRATDHRVLYPHVDTRDLPPYEILSDWMRDYIKSGVLEPFHDMRTGEILGYRNVTPGEPGNP
jgi:hypothetical protein